MESPRLAETTDKPGAACSLMEWIKLDLKTLDSPEYVGSEPVERATWVNLTGYCAKQENGGRILDCASWPDRMWQQICGVTQGETRLECDLYHWEGDDLVVAFYPIKTEEIVQSRREAGKAGASARWQKQDLPMAKTDSAYTDQTRPEETRPYKSRPEGKPEASASGRAGMDWEKMGLELSLMNGRLPDRHRAESLAREFYDEMIGCNWIINGKPVSNPMGLLVKRLKTDGAYKVKAKA